MIENHPEPMKRRNDGQPRPLTPAELERWYAAIHRRRDSAAYRDRVEALRKAIEERHGGALVKVVLD